MATPQTQPQLDQPPPLWAAAGVAADEPARPSDVRTRPVHLTRTSSTSALAGEQATKRSGTWRRRILEAMRGHPQGLALFELAALFGVPDHILSGRVTDLRRDGHIETTGQRRRKPATGCLAEVYRLTGSAAARRDVADLLSYPRTMRIGDELLERQPLLPQEGYPGIPYAVRGDGPRRHRRVELVECPACGKSLSLRMLGGEKYFDCRCGRTWRLRVATIDDGDTAVVLVMESTSAESIRSCHGAAPR